MSAQRDSDVTVEARRSAGKHSAGDGHHTAAHHTGSPSGARAGLGARVPMVHRLGALTVGGFLLVFGILGFAGGLPFFSTEGESILGLSSNGLLSALSVATAAVLIGAAFSGPRLASTVMLALGSLFLLSALLNMAVLQTNFNVLAFRMSNVIFSIGVGLVLLVLGAYGRIGGHLPPDSPYVHPDAEAEESDPVDETPATPAESDAERAMREAEIAVVQHIATPEQNRRVAAMAPERTRLGRRRVWMRLDRTSS